MSLPANVSRIRIPFVVKDLVTVENPEVLRKIAGSADIGRPGEADLPWIFRYWFPSTKFYYPPTKQFFVALEGDEKNNRAERRKVIEDQLAKGFTEEHISTLVELIKGDGDMATVGAECAKIVGDIILPLKNGERVPDNVAKASFNTALDFNAVINPFVYIRGKESRRTVEDYIRTLVPEEDNIGDYAHNLGAAAQGLGKACVSMRNIKHNDLRIHFGHNPITVSTIRVPLKTTTLDGLFPENAPLTKDSVIVMEIASGAKETLDDLFLFASGVDKRQCPFKNLFFEGTAEVQKRL